jgi:predicted nucleic acid-binding Zn ribbon protein
MTSSRHKKCVVCGRFIGRYKHKLCGDECYRTYRRLKERRSRKIIDQKYVRIPVIKRCGTFGSQIGYEKVYADGMAQEIQKRVPELMQKISKKLLRENGRNTNE